VPSSQKKKAEKEAAQLEETFAGDIDKVDTNIGRLGKKSWSNSVRYAQQTSKIQLETQFINKTERIELIKSTGEKDVNRISHGISFRHRKQWRF